MTKVQRKFMGQKIWLLKESSIPHLNTMEWNAPVMNNTAGITPKIVAKAIPTLVCARRFLAIRSEERRVGKEC